MSASASTSPPHLSIGDVLNQLREEFPDVTISKIRFLESQGLIDPERTPSGYRKFYDADIARLRWILHQQKEHFLPLKVIKERLEQLDREGEAPSVDHASDDAGDEPAEPAARAEPARTGNGEVAAPARRRRPPADDPTAPELPLDGATQPETPAPSGRAGPDGGVSLTRTELAAAAGLDDAQVGELEAYGLLAPTPSSGDHPLFDEEALAIARTAAGFYRHGIEARHLRMYKHFAQREAALFEQVLLAYRRQRNPEARAQAQRDLEELARLGRALRAALLVTEVREAIAD